MSIILTEEQLQLIETELNALKSNLSTIPLSGHGWDIVNTLQKIDELEDILNLKKIEL